MPKVGFADAEAHFRKALDLAEGIGYVAAAALSLVGLGQVALRRGNLELARELHRQGLLAQREAGGAYLASGLAYLASVEAAAEQHDRAQRLMGANEAWHAARGGALEVWLPWTHGPLRRGLVPVPGVPIDPLLVQARAEGRAMSLDEAVASALRAPDPVRAWREYRADMATTDEPFDLIVRGATVFDGSGAPGARADVGLRGDRIAAVQSDLRGSAARELDARGLALTPGFIDVHSHDDFAVLLQPEMPFKVLQGVTTDIVGNCGSGVVPFEAGLESFSAFASGC